MGSIARGLRAAGAILIGPVLNGVLIGLLAIEGPMLQMAGYGGPGIKGSRDQGIKSEQTARPTTSSPALPAGEDRGEGSLVRSTLGPLHPRPLEPSAIASALGLGAQAQAAPPPPGGECEPPDCIPLPSPITVARTLSHYAADSLQNDGGTLTITYNVFNARDEEVGEILLVTTLPAGVSYVPASTNPQPDEPTPPDGRLAFVLPSIPAFGQIAMTLTVDVPNGVTQIDDGARVFGNIRTRAVKADVGPTVLPATLGVSEDFLRSTIDANTSDRYVLETIGRVGCDPIDLFEYVRDDIGYEAYRGSLRGARGTLWSKAGNALDQSSLLIAMLRACGVPSRYVSGTLAVPQAQDLILSMFPPITRAVGGLPPADLPQIGNVDINDLLLNASQFLPGADQISDPANDPELLSEPQDHFWVQYHDGASFVHLDPTFGGAAVGQTFTTPESEFVEVDDAIRHKVSFELVAETMMTGAGGVLLNVAGELGGLPPNPRQRITQVASQFAVEGTVLDQTLRTVELVGEPVSFGQFVGIYLFGAIITYSPWMQIGNREELVRGTDYQEMYGLIGSNVLSGLFLRMKVIDALGATQDYERALVDRIGFAIRQGEGGVVNINNSFGEAALTDFDIVTVAATSSLEDTDTAEAEHESALGLQRQLDTVADLDPSDASIARSFIIARERSLLSAAFVISDTFETALDKAMSTASYLGAPVLTLSGFRIKVGDDTLELEVFMDLRKHDTRALASPGSPLSSGFSFRSRRGFILAQAERAVLPAAPAAMSALDVIEAAIAQDIPLIAVAAADSDDLDNLAWSDEARSRVHRALADGRTVVAPSAMVSIGGRITTAWWEIDNNTGDAIAVTEDGGNAGIVDFTLWARSVLVPVLTRIPREIVLRLPLKTLRVSGIPKTITWLCNVCGRAPVLPFGNEVKVKAILNAIEAVGCETCLSMGALAGFIKQMDPPLGPRLEDPEPVGNTHNVVSRSLAAVAQFQILGDMLGSVGSSFARVAAMVPDAGSAVGIYPEALSGIGASGSLAGGPANFDSALFLSLSAAAVNIDALERSLTLGGTTIIGAPVNVGVTAFSGSLIAADNGPSDTVDLSGTFDRVLIVSVDPQSVTATQDSNVVITSTVKGNAADTYTLTAEAPEGWTMQMAADGTTTIRPGPGAVATTYEVRFSAQSETVPELRAEARAYINVVAPDTPAIDVRVVQDAVFSVPDEGSLAQSAYRVEIQNLSTTGDTFDVDVSGLPEEDFTQAVESVVVGPGNRGIVGIAVHPLSGLLAPGTPGSFSVTATGRTTGLTDTESVSFPYPEVVGVRPSFAPGAIATTPGSTVMTDLILTAASNVDSPFTLAVDDGGIGIAGVPSSANVVPGQTISIPVTVGVPASAPVGTSILVSVTADLCNGANPCTVPLPSERFAGLAVLIGSPEATCILADAVTARELDLDELAAALEDMGHAFSRLSLDRPEVLLQGRAVASGDAVVALLRDAGRTALADDLEALLAEIASGDDTRIQAALASACTVLAPLNGELGVIASERDHGFRISLAPSGRSVTLNEPAQYTLRLAHIGTLDSTINLSVPGLPPGVTAQLSQSSVTLEPKQVIDETSGTPITVTLTSTAERVPALGFAVSGQVAEAPAVVASARGLLGVRTSAVDVVAVRPAPQVVNPAGTPVAVSAELLNSANVARTVAVTLRVEDSTGTPVFTGTPQTVSLATGGSTTSVDLGSVDTTGLPDGAFTAIVTAQNAGGTPLPGRQGRGSFLIGVPVVASASVEPAQVPPGSAEHVVSKVNVRARSSSPPGTGFHDQFAKAVSISTATTTPAEALGPPDHRVAVVNSGGSLLLDLGADLDRISDGPGTDLVVFERNPNGCFEAGGNAYQVDVSDDADGPFTPLGSASGTRETGDELDIGSVGLTSARYVRITPTSGAVSIDAVLAAHTHHPGSIHLDHVLATGTEEGVAHPPAVGDIDGDGVPDIVIVSEIFFTQCDVIAIDGRTNAEKWRYPLPFGHAGVASACGNINSPAIADFDGDGVPEIVINRFASGAFGAGGPTIYVFKNDGTLLRQHSATAEGYSPALENLLGDARPEITTKGGFLENDGTLRQFIGFDAGRIAVDVDGNGTQELVGVAACFPSFLGDCFNAIAPDRSLVWGTPAGGSSAGHSKMSVADLDRDGQPEMVGAFRSPSARRVYVVEHDGTLGWRHDFPPPIRHCSTTRSQVCQAPADCPAGEACDDPDLLPSFISRPSIADLNGDGRPDIAVVVLNLGNENRDQVVALDADGTELWRAEARDPGGFPPGVSTADLDGDGAAEVLWNGYCSGFSIFDGRTGRVLYRDPRVHSASAEDYPVAADADADGHLDVITGDIDGLYVFSDTEGWGAGRAIWNQGDYRVTNIRDDLTVPAVQPDSWKWHNTYLSQSATIIDLARAQVTIDHRLASGVTFQTGDIDPPASSIAGQQIQWAPPPFALSMGDTFSVGVDLPPLRPGESHVVSESTTVSATLNFLSGQTGSTSLTLDPVAVYAPHIIGVEPESREVAPGATAVFGVRVRNVRSVPEVFTLSVVGVDPASVTLPAPVNLAANAEAVLPLSIAISPSTSAGTIDFNVVASGDQGTLDEAGARIDVRGSLASGLHVEVEPVNDIAGQGTSGLFRIIVTNTGNATQTILLSAALPPGVTANFESTIISVPPGLTGSRETVVSLAVTPGTLAGDALFTITATSTSDPDLSATAQGTLTIRSSGVAIDLSPDAVQVAPQNGTVFTALITNTGDDVDTFILNLAGPVANFASFTTPSVLLQPGASIAVPISVGSLEPFLLQRTFLIAQAHSLTDPLVQATDAAVIDVGAFRAVTAAFESGSTATGCSVSTDLALLITNAGNAGDERYTMTFDSVPAGVMLTPVTTQFLVPPLKTARIPIAVAPPGTGTFNITATINTDGDPLCIVPPCTSLPGVGTSTAVQLTTVVDGVACSDANACTHSDTCVNGVCVGSPVDCSQTDECHDAGLCDPLSGCPNASPNGTACDDSSVCTSGETCQAGACVGAPAVSCGPCGTCDPILGTCSGACTPTPTSTAAPTTVPTVTPTASGTPTPTPLLDHFECHKAKMNGGQSSFVPIPGISLIDHFGPLTVDARAPVRLCNPTNKNAEDPSAPAHGEHLTSYKIKRAAGAARFVKVTDQIVADQFGSLAIDVIKPRQLLVPSAKSLSSSPPELTDPFTDHFTCYKIRLAEGAPAFVPVAGVSLEDQFGPTTVDIVKPVAVCAPTDKAGEDPGAPTHAGFLTCYKVKAVAGSPRFSPLAPVFVNNQFGPASLKVSRTKNLCLPSALNPTPTGTPTATIVAVTPTPSSTVVVTPTPSGTATQAPSGTATATGTPAPTATLPPTRTRTATATPTVTPTPTQTGTATPTSGDVVDTILIGGPPVTVTIAQVGRNGRLVFGGTAGQRISLVKSGIAGTVQILNPDGSPLMAASSSSFIDVQALLSSGLYMIVFIPSGGGTGSATFTLYDVPPDVGGEIPTDGEPVTIVIPVPGRNARLTFDGSAGQRVSLRWSDLTIQCCATVLKIKNPDGTDFYTANFNGAFFVDPLMLTQTGTHAITFDPAGAATGEVTLSLNIVTDSSGVIPLDGTAETIAIDTPGEIARRTFAGSVGQRIGVLISGSSFGGFASRIRIKNPDASVLLDSTLGGQFQERSLPQVGTYTVELDPGAADTGSIIIAVYEIIDVTGNITPGGPPVMLSLATPGQNALLAFTAAAGQRMAVQVSGSTFAFGSNVAKIVNPDDTILASILFPVANAFMEPQLLSQTGIHKLVIDPTEGNTGTVTVGLYDVVDVTGPIVSGSPVHVTLSTPGQVARLTFDGTAGQPVTVTLSNSTLGFSEVGIKNPDGTTLFSGFTFGGLTLNQTLTQTGTHTIVINPDAANTGSGDVSLSM